MDESSIQPGAASQTWTKIGRTQHQPQTHQRRRGRCREPRDQIRCSMMEVVARLFAAPNTGANGLDPGSRFKDPERTRSEPPNDRTTEAGAGTRRPVLTN